MGKPSVEFGRIDAAETKEHGRSTDILARQERLVDQLLGINDSLPYLNTKFLGKPVVDLLHAAYSKLSDQITSSLVRVNGNEDEATALHELRQLTTASQTDTKADERPEYFSFEDLLDTEAFRHEEQVAKEKNFLSRLGSAWNRRGRKRSKEKELGERRSKRSAMAEKIQQLAPEDQLVQAEHDMRDIRKLLRLVWLVQSVLTPSTEMVKVTEATPHSSAATVGARDEALNTLYGRRAITPKQQALAADCLRLLQAFADPTNRGTKDKQADALAQAGEQLMYALDARQQITDLKKAVGERRHEVEHAHADRLQKLKGWRTMIEAFVGEGANGWKELDTQLQASEEALTREFSNVQAGLDTIEAQLTAAEQGSDDLETTTKVEGMITLSKEGTLDTSRLFNLTGFNTVIAATDTLVEKAQVTFKGAGKDREIQQREAVVRERREIAKTYELAEQLFGENFYTTERVKNAFSLKDGSCLFEHNDEDDLEAGRQLVAKFAEPDVQKFLQWMKEHPKARGADAYILIFCPNGLSMELLEKKLEPEMIAAKQCNHLLSFEELAGYARELPLYTQETQFGWVIMPRKPIYNDSLVLKERHGNCLKQKTDPVGLSVQLSRIPRPIELVYRNLLVFRDHRERVAPDYWEVTDVNLDDWQNIIVGSTDKEGIKVSTVRHNNIAPKGLMKTVPFVR